MRKPLRVHLTPTLDERHEKYAYFKLRRSQLELQNLKEAIRIIREGYAFAREYREWFPAVNCCPYGQAHPDDLNWKAHCWYYGFWFWHYVFKRWMDLCR